MATYSTNTTLKVNAAVSNTQTRTGNGTTTIYTAPANAYSLVNISQAGVNASGVQFTVGAVTLAFQSATPTTYVFLQNVPVGPGQSVAVTISGYTGGTASMSVSGVEFINTP